MRLRGIAFKEVNMAFFRNFRDSLCELKSLRCLTVTALLIGVSVALKFLLIQPTETLKISFSFIGLASIGMLYGPVVAGLAGIATDVLGFLVKPTGAFSPIFTVVELTAGVIYGIFLYRLNPAKIELFSSSAFFDAVKKNGIQVLRIFCAKLTVNLICNVVMNTFAMVLMRIIAPDAILVKIGERIVKNAVLLPIEVFILLAVLYPVAVAYRAAFRKHTIAK